MNCKKEQEIKEFTEVAKELWREAEQPAMPTIVIAQIDDAEYSEEWNK